MGIAYLYGNGGGSGSGGTLVVTAPEEATVTVSKDGKSLTKPIGTDGTVKFTGLETGTWTLSITDGVQTVSQPVTINTDYSATIAFFSATINITYPAGSICTCTNGIAKFTAPDTSGTWACIVSNAGTWTVSCTDGIDTDSADVTITTDGQSENVELAYWDGELYDQGDEFNKVTGGWIFTRMTTDSWLEQGVGTKKTTSIYLECETDVDLVCVTNNKIDLTNYSTLKCNITSLSGKYYSQVADGECRLVIATDQTTGKNGAACAIASSAGELSLDIGSFSGSYYVAIGAYAGEGDYHYIEFDKVWME